MSKVPETSDNMKLCICLTCPTYKKCKLTGGLFCAKGKAKEKAKKEGCICNNCAVYSKYNVKGSYFCRKPAKMLWWILGLAVIIIIIAVIGGILLSGGFSTPPTPTPTPQPTATPTPTPAPTPTPTSTAPPVA
jgi:hypothetical protein